MNEYKHNDIINHIVIMLFILNILFNQKLLVVCCFVGYGTRATQAFAKGDFLLVYRGDLIEYSEASKREVAYKTDECGCFMYYFKYNGQTMW